MAELSVTDDQADEIDRLREEIAAAFVDTYGHVRRRDVVQYLLDTYTPPEDRGATRLGNGEDPIASATYSELQGVAATVSGVSGSGTGADQMRGELVSELGAAELAQRLASVDADAGSEASNGTDTDDTSNGAETDESDGNGSDDPLSGTHRLLDEHDGKWRQAETGDEPYEVDLPDGDTESARTKDDVKRLLFRHY